MGPIARTMNALGGDFRWQHLPVPFEVYADGIDLVIFEEFGSGAAALHLADQVERNALLQDEDYRRRFRKDYDAKFGMRVWHRDFFDAEIVDCPDDGVVGKTFGAGRRSSAAACTRSTRSSTSSSSTAPSCGGARRSPTTARSTSTSSAATPACRSGSPTPGAHLRNMAFYNFGLRFLRRVHDAERDGRAFMSLEHAVHRLTGELADWYSLDAGHLRVGDRADVVVVDPAHLDDELDAYAESPRRSLRPPAPHGQPQRRRRPRGAGQRLARLRRRRRSRRPRAAAHRPVPARALTAPVAGV